MSASIYTIHTSYKYSCEKKRPVFCELLAQRVLLRPHLLLSSFWSKRTSFPTHTCIFVYLHWNLRPRDIFVYPLFCSPFTFDDGICTRWNHYEPFHLPTFEQRERYCAANSQMFFFLFRCSSLSVSMQRRFVSGLRLPEIRTLLDTSYFLSNIEVQNQLGNVETLVLEALKKCAIDERNGVRLNIFITSEKCPNYLEQSFGPLCANLTHKHSCHLLGFQVFDKHTFDGFPMGFLTIVRWSSAAPNPIIHPLVITEICTGVTVAYSPPYLICSFPFSFCDLSEPSYELRTLLWTSLYDLTFVMTLREKYLSQYNFNLIFRLFSYRWWF